MSAYRNCRWCHGRGCISCPAESKKGYERAFPNGPELVASFKTDDPEDMDKARRIIGLEAIQKAFAPGGGGVAEIIANAAREGKTPENPFPFAPE